MFFDSVLVYSNLGGSGPHFNRPASIRYANVGSTLIPGVGTFRFDLVVSARSAYTPSDTSSNGLNGRFAQVNVAANTHVDLRVQTFPSCCTEQNCLVCDRESDDAAREQCYNRGCCCFDRIVSFPGGCPPVATDPARQSCSSDVLEPLRTHQQ
jgi:hypothetical protein